MLQVSWIRHRDIHILTVGAYTYTSDQRFQAIHHRSHSDQWTLHIKWAQKRDAGIYECQVSTQPVRSIFVTLNVVGKCTHRVYLHIFFKVSHHIIRNIRRVYTGRWCITADFVSHLSCKQSFSQRRYLRR